MFPYPSMKPARTPLVSLEAWKAAQKAGQCPPVAVRQTFEIEQKEGDLSIVMSSATEDRMGDTINQAGQQIIQRQLQVAPTLTIRPGFPVRVIVTRDLVLEPYRG